MHCPICQSKETDFFAKKSSYIFYRCISCKCLFMKALPSLSELDEYYKNNFQYQDGALNEKIIRIQSKRILKQLLNSFPTAKTICDVGSGYGFFLDEAKKKNYEVFGIEPAKPLAKNSKQEFNLPIFAGTLTEYLKSQKKKYDIVTCIHVIEHVRNPKQFIDSLLRLVKPGGLLYLETPNSDSHLLYVEKDNYTFLIPPDHLWLLSHKSIGLILPEKYYIEKTRTYSSSEHLMGIVKTMLGKKSSKNGSKTPSVHTQVNLGYNFESLRKRVSHLIFDTILAPLFTDLLNLNHKGSILELYIKKKAHKSGL